MRVPLSWLRDYVSLELTPEALADQLTLLGMEVKSVERWGADWQNIVIGELLAVEKHPRADRLSLTRVTLGGGEMLEIVCGATNIAPGQRVPVALPGAVLPGDRRIERTEKMGVTSNGMLCSGDELRLTGDAEGILILPPDTPLGVPLVDLYGDVVLDVDVKPNRGDALSLVGLAREVAAATGATVRWPDIRVEDSGPDIAGRLRVDVEDPGLCSRFVGRLVEGVSMGPSPDVAQMRLLAAGMRPISNVVDASNYVMLELGKPIHTFDAAAIAGGHIVVRTARAGERLETLDHELRDLDPETLLIADPRGPLAIAGIMGGAASEVSDATVNVVVESAIFDPVSIRRSAHRYALRSEASLRFEKGQESRLARFGADRTAQLILEWAGGQIARGRVDSAPAEPPDARVAFRPARVNRLLGTRLSADEQRRLLARVEIETEPAPATTQVAVAGPPMALAVVADGSETLLAIIPSWRRDLAIEADIAEEVARLHGYEAIPSILPDTEMPHYRPAPFAARDAARATLVGAGVTEVVTYALVSPRHVETFLPDAGSPAPDGEAMAGGAPVAVTNPLSSQHALLRQSLLGSLLDVVRANVRQGQDDVAIFEIGKGYARDGASSREWWQLGIALTGEAAPVHWNRPARHVDLDDLKGIVELVGSRLGLGHVTYVALTDDPVFHPGRSARIELRDRRGELGLSGRIGEVDPRTLDAWDVRAERVVAAEVALAGLSGGGLPAVRATPVSRQPAVHRDLAVVVDESMPAGDVERAIRRAGGDLLQRLTLFDIYRGAPLAATDKSLAFRLLFQASGRTLTEDEIEAIVARVTERLATDVGGRLRT